jgi:hypothetical protein
MSCSASLKILCPHEETYEFRMILPHPDSILNFKNCNIDFI